MLHHVNNRSEESPAYISTTARTCPNSQLPKYSRIMISKNDGETTDTDMVVRLVFCCACSLLWFFIGLSTVSSPVLIMIFFPFISGGRNTSPVSVKEIRLDTVTSEDEKREKVDERGQGENEEAETQGFCRKAQREGKDLEVRKVLLDFQGGFNEEGCSYELQSTVPEKI